MDIYIVNYKYTDCDGSIDELTFDEGFLNEADAIGFMLDDFNRTKDDMVDNENRDVAETHIGRDWARLEIYGRCMDSGDDTWTWSVHKVSVKEA